MTEESASDSPNPEKLWRHRRWMGWYGVVGSGASPLIGIAVIALSSQPAPEQVDAVVSITRASIWGHLGLAAIYAGGASVVDAVARLRHGGRA